jgi:ankyrin repeat protein
MESQDQQHHQNGHELLEAAQRGDLNTVKKLLQSTDPNFFHPETGDTALHFAAYFDEADILEVLLIHKDIKISHTNHKGYSCLHNAAVSNSIRALEKLLQHNTLLDMKNEWEETALHLAAAAGHSRAVELLLKAGASILITDKWGRSASRVAWDQGETATSRLLPLSQDEKVQEDRTVHSEVISRQQQTLIQKEFMEKLRSKPKSESFDIEVKHIFSSNDKTASSVSQSVPAKTTPVQAPTVNQANIRKQSLSKLVEYPGDVAKIQQWLNDPSIDPAGKDFYGLPALHKFASWDKVDLLDLLLPQLSSSDVNTQGGDDGSTALHSCIEMGAVRALERLAKDERIIPTTTNKRGKTIKHLAEENGDSETLKVIQTLWPNLF